MANPPAKRARYAQKVPESRFNRDFTAACIDNLEQSSLRSILLRAAERDGEVEDMINAESQRLIQAEQARVISFDHYSKYAWKAINVTYSSMNGSQQYHRALEVQGEIEGYIQTIQDGCAGHASFGTKMNGLETLRKIGKTVALSHGDVIASEVQNGFQGRSILERTMKKILSGMRGDEIEDLRRSGNPEGAWLEKLVELEELAASRCLFEGLEDVVALLRRDEHDDDEESEDDESANEDASDEVEDDDTGDNDEVAGH